MMGQHKHNPTAIAAAKGEIGPKPKSTMSRRDIEQIAREYLMRRTGAYSLMEILRREM